MRISLIITLMSLNSPVTNNIPITINTSGTHAALFKGSCAANILKKYLKEHISKLISYYMNVNIDMHKRLIFLFVLNVLFMLY